ncbi:DNA polymerase epsilon subunit D [Meyerozyma sp. JA9]|nr:DNA polymerase epsilon subunit D [Meyerozyma sp. JA9]
MPPKGWRKNADGQYPEPPKEDTPVSIDDLLFPRSTIQKLAKQMISDNESNMLMAKDALLALQRSATVFVSNVMFHARQISKEQDRKGINSQDIMGALERAEFTGFIPEVRDRLASFEQAQAMRRAKKKEEKEENAAKPATEGDESTVKRQKDNSEAAIPKQNVDADNEEESDADVDENDDEKEDTEMAEGDADAEGSEDEQARNPIEILGDEEQELGGTEAETQERESEEEEI